MAEAAFLYRMGMSWPDYLAMPDKVFRRILLLGNAEAEAQKKNG